MIRWAFLAGSSVISGISHFFVMRTFGMLSLFEIQRMLLHTIAFSVTEQQDGFPHHPTASFPPLTSADNTLFSTSLRSAVSDCTGVKSCEVRLSGLGLLHLTFFIPGSSMLS